MRTDIRRVAILVLMLIVIGVFLWAVNTYVPMANSIRAILNIVVFVATCIYVLQAFGLWASVVRLWYDARYRITRSNHTPPQAL